MIKIISVGKLKEDFNKKAADEFLKRLQRFYRVDIIEIPSSKDESEKILKQIKDTDFAVIMDEHGIQKSSIEFSEVIKSNLEKNIVFIIGSAEGLEDKVKARANVTLSLSKMTFLHEMARVFLIEQIYRAFTIMKNMEYHK